MAERDIKDFIKYIKDRAYDIEERQKRKLLISVEFTRKGKTFPKIKEETRSGIFQLHKMIIYERPEKIKIIFNINGEKSEYSYDIIEENDEKPSLPTKNDRVEFSGLGEAEIENIVNKRLSEERRRREIDDLTKELCSKSDEIAKISSENSDLQLKVNEKNDRITELENELEAKKTIRYFAGFAGDILQSFGIKKEHIRQPLAGLMSDDNYETPKKSLNDKTTKRDESGIVEESSDPQQEKRNELIVLIGDYLQTTDNETLGNIFYIFSEIEQKKQLSGDLVSYLKKEDGR